MIPRVESVRGRRINGAIPAAAGERRVVILVVHRGRGGLGINRSRIVFVSRLCPNNDCGPRYNRNRDGKGRGGWEFLYLSFQGFSWEAIGPSTTPAGAAPPTLRSPITPAERERRKEEARRQRAGMGGLGDLEGQSEGSWSVGFFRQPQNSGAITQGERDAANNLIDKNYDRCRKLLGANDLEAPGREGAGLALSAAQDNVDDATMIGAIWAHESGINTIDYYGDAGPAQLTSWWRKNQKQLIVGNAYGTCTADWCQGGTIRLMAVFKTTWRRCGTLCVLVETDTVRTT